MAVYTTGEEIAQKTTCRQEVRYKRPNWQFPEKEERPPVGTWKGPQEEHLCLRRAGSGGGQLSRDTAKADKKENRPRAGRSLRLIWNNVRTVAGTGASHTET